MASTGKRIENGKHVPNWFRPFWMHRKVRQLAKRDAVRARDGDLCWRCAHPMRFAGKPNCGKAATVEHVVPLSRGGTWALGNLKLCHVGCNRYLAANTPEKKERMRINVREITNGR